MFLSLPKITVFFEFHPTNCFVKDQVSKKVLLQGALDGGLYKLNLNKAKESSGQSHVLVSETQDSIPSRLDFCQNHNKNSFSFDLWHRRLGHPSSKIVTKILSECNIKLQSNEKFPFFCTSCQMGRSHKLPFKKSLTQYTSPVELVESDLWDPSPILSSIGYRYYVSFVDAFSRYTWIYFLKNKSETFESFLHFKMQAENLINTRINFFQSDWGGEFCSFSSFFDK